MKKYNVTINGVTYEVMVEEVSEPVVSSVPITPTANAAPKKPIPAPNKEPVVSKPITQETSAPAPKLSAEEGAVKVTAPMPGTILKINVKIGDTIKSGDLVCVLEAMKMENEIFASEGGVVKSIEAAQGSSVNSGDVIITLG